VSHEFSRYIDTENGNAYLDNCVGKCNRTNNCNYHYTPKQFFADTGLPDGFKKSPFKSKKARTAAALARAFSLEPIQTPVSEQKNASESEQRETQSKLERLRREMEQFQAVFENSPAEKYLQSRGITAETAKAFGCGYAERFEHWKKTAGEWEIIGADRRVVFPITDQSGQVVAYHGRAIDDVFIDTPKKTKGSRKEALFQTANAFDADVIFLCEGPADAMALHECGFAAVASVATSIPSWLPNRLAYRKVMVALDADETGDRDAEKHINGLRAHGARAFRLRPEAAKDWNDALLNTGAEALRNFTQVKIYEAYPDYELPPQSNYIEPNESLKFLHKSPHFTGWTNASLF
jgi:DNA primase